MIAGQGRGATAGSAGGTSPEREGIGTMKGSLESRPARAVREAAWRAEGLWLDEPLIAALERGAAARPDVGLTFLSAERPSATTTGELLARAERVAAGLHALGLRQGDVIVSQTPHWQEGVELVVAALRLGLVIVPVVHIYGPAELGFLIRQTRARALVLPDKWLNIDYADRVGKLGDLPDLEHVIVIGDPATMPRPAIGWTEMVAGGEGGESPRTPGEPDDICLILFTSGTTAAPKGALHSQRGLGAEIRQSSCYIDPAKPGAMMAILPAGHIGGLTASLRPFTSYEPVVYLDKWGLDRGLKAINELGAIRTIGTPFHINALIESRQVAPGALHMVAGGAGIAPSVVSRADTAGIVCYRSWGATEHPTGSTSLPTDDFESRGLTDGAVMDGCDILIVDDDGRELPRGERGEILSIGPDLCEGYLDPALNAAGFTADGWYRTGDIGILDTQNRLTIVDRKKDIIIRGGENISSKEVEDALVRHPRISDAAAVGWPDDIYGERVGAFVTLSEGETIDVAEVLGHFIAIGVAKQKTPEVIIVLPEFPRNLSGKVLKHELRAKAKTMAAG
jgi:acyl-CoA synthetase (AMP-forming)/AMP-acid ligase II